MVRVLYLWVVYTQPFNANLGCQRRSEGCARRQFITSDFVEKGSLKENRYSEIRSFVQAEIASILYYTILYYTIL